MKSYMKIIYYLWQVLNVLTFASTILIFVGQMGFLFDTSIEKDLWHYLLTIPIIHLIIIAYFNMKFTKEGYVKYREEYVKR